MPQMAPSMWVYITLMIIMMLIFLMSFIFFMETQWSSKSKKEFKTVNKKLLW